MFETSYIAQTVDSCTRILTVFCYSVIGLQRVNASCNNNNNNNNDNSNNVLGAFRKSHCSYRSSNTHCTL